MTTIDQQQYDELRRVMGSDIGVLVASFERDCQQRIADAQDAFAANDFERLRRIAHTLKGGALGMAALALAEEWGGGQLSPSTGTVAGLAWR